MSINTKKTYTSILSKLNLISDINDHNKTIKIIAKLPNKNSSKKNYYIALLNNFKDDKNSEKYKSYYKEMERYRNLQNSETDKNEKNEKQKNNWCTYDELRNATIMAKKNIDDIINDKIIDKYEKYKMYRDYILLLIYTHLPPLRNDYLTVKINTGKNYYNDGKLILTEYKNSKKMGKYIFEYPELIRNEIDKYLDFKKDNDIPNKYMFVNNLGKKYNSSTFGNHISGIFNKLIGKKISINLIRHMYETELITNPKYLKMTLEEKKIEHAKLLHSFTTAQQYVKL